MDYSLLVRILLVCIVLLAIYYFVKWLNGSGDLQDRVIYSNSKPGLLAMSTTATVFPSTALPPLYGGGEFSISTWIYITNWAINRGSNKVFLTLSGGGSGYSTLVMYLGQNINKLGVRVSTDSTDVSNTLNSAQMDKITSGLTPYSDTDGDFSKCDIQTVDLQRWVNITVVLTGRTADVYMDGKLSRSCVLNGLYKVDGDVPSLSLGGPSGFGGYIGQTRGANYAYSPDQVYLNYLNGPNNVSLLSQILRMFGIVDIPTVPTLPSVSISAPVITIT